MSNHREAFVNLLLELSQANPTNFSGVGLVFYDDLQFLSQYHCDLIENAPAIPFLMLGTRELYDYLLEISDYHHPFHDGFHFINAEGVLTHIAQFFSPPVEKTIPRTAGQGARTFCAQCGSKVAGVVMVGSVSSNAGVYLFEQGERVNDFGSVDEFKRSNSQRVQA